MSRTNNFFKMVFSALLVVSIILVNVSVAFADDGTPPAETPTTEPTEEVVETETVTPEETPTPEVDVVVTPTPEETPIVEEQVPAEEEAVEPALFELIPENTEVIVLDENGESIPLVSEAALDAILDTDPIWCPGNILPGPGCNTNFSTISALLTDMRNNTGNYDANGTIYFTANTGASLVLTDAGSSLGGADFNTLNDFDLTLQGGWNGVIGAGAIISGQTNFGSNTLTIGTSSNPWVGNITINGFTFNGVTSGNAVTIYTTSGDITLNNVDVMQQGGTNYTANLDSQSGDITVQNGSTFDGNNSGANQSRGFRAETNTGSITISDTNFSDSHGCSFVLFGNCILDALVNYSGATLSAPTVTLNNVASSNNDLSGIAITNANSIWLNNVVTINNGSLLILGSGINVTGTGTTVVNVNGGTFSNNEPYGIYVTGSSIAVHSPATCNGNLVPGFDGCYNIAPLDTIPPVLSLPADITVEATGSSGAIVTFSPTANDAVDGPVSVTCSPISGSTFAIGTTAVNCSASDTRGNTATGSFNVTVQDTTPPALTLPADITTEATGPSGAVVTFSASATDLVDASVTVICSTASGSTFALDVTTPVTCTATDDSGNSTSRSFNVTVQDTTPPVISHHTDIIDKTDNASGDVVLYSSPTIFDIVDGTSVAICTPSSGSEFPTATTAVTCTAQDSHGNIATPVTFLVTLKLKSTGAVDDLSSGFLITVTGGELIDLECNTILNAFGVKVTFYNLCDHQAVMDEILANTLPAGLPNGYAFVKGLNINVLFDGDALKELPHTGGIELDFPITDNSQDQYAVLVWDNENNSWLDVTQTMKDADLAKMLSTETENELYQIVPTEITKALYRILSTDKAGTFVIVKK